MNKQTTIIELAKIKDQLEYARKFTNIIEAKIRDDFGTEGIITDIKLEQIRLQNQIDAFDKILKVYGENKGHKVVLTITGIDNSGLAEATRNLLAEYADDNDFGQNGWTFKVTAK